MTKDCKSCGAIPEVVKEDDGYWYVLCGSCGADPTWDKKKQNAIDNWNQRQETPCDQSKN
jgi:uncharacterized Zn finger protein